MSHRSAEPDEITSPPRSRGALVIVEQAAEARTSTNPADGCWSLARPRSMRSQPLMIPLAMIVRDEFRDRSSEMALANRDQPIEALLFDRSHEPFSIGVRIRRLIRRLHHADPRLAQPGAHRRAPLRVAITDQHVMLDEQPVVRGGQRPRDLAA